MPVPCAARGRAVARPRTRRFEHQSIYVADATARESRANFTVGNTAHEANPTSALCRRFGFLLNQAVFARNMNRRAGEGRGIEAPRFGFPVKWPPQTRNPNRRQTVAWRRRAAGCGMRASGGKLRDAGGKLRDAGGGHQAVSCGQPTWMRRVRPRSGRRANRSTRPCPYPWWRSRKSAAPAGSGCRARPRRRPCRSRRQGQRRPC